MVAPVLAKNLVRVYLGPLLFFFSFSLLPYLYCTLLLAFLSTLLTLTPLSLPTFKPTSLDDLRKKKEYYLSLVNKFLLYLTLSSNRSVT